MGELLEACRTSFQLDPQAEVTLEANPGTVDLAYLTALRQAGFNRLSLGVQSFQDELLQRIGRIHSSAQAAQALADARTAGFDNVSLDLIYGLPGQSLADFQADLERVGELRPEHLSAYALTVEPNTRLEAQIRLGEIAPPDPDLQADMADLLPPFLRPLGYRRYEISNWARSGRACRHNLIYWRNRPYLGLGCGATSYIDGWRTRRILHPRYYATALAQGRTPVIEHERLGLEGTLKDVITLALRTRRGLDLDRLYRRYPVLPERVEGFLDGLPTGLVRRQGSRIRLTGRGRNLANVVFVELLDTLLTSG
jgi:oxygen-independent coproporphyrinogen-3 oxidase